MKRFLFLIIPVALLLCCGSFLKKEKTGSGFEDKWSGYVVFTYTMIDKGDVTEGPSRSQWNKSRDASMFIRVTNNKGSADVKEKLTNWEKTTVTYASGPPAVQIKKSNGSGQGSGDVIVWVEMNYETGKYWLKTDGPSYNVQRVDSFIQNSLGTNIIQSGDNYSAEQPGFPVDAPDQLIGNSPNEVKGRYVIMSSRTHYVVVSWDLKKTGKSQIPVTHNPKNQNAKSNPNSNSNSGSNSNSNPGQNSGSNQSRQDHFDFVELIVTPENYDAWLPTAGGGKLKVSLEVRGKNGGPPSSPAVSFELTLFSTSIGGYTSTAASGSPDLRFLSQANAVLSNQDQLMTMPCVNGRTGEFFIDSHHPSASTTLVAMAILADGRWIKGNLLKSGGPTEIPIPKTITQ